MNEVLLKAEGIYKSFGATKAVVDFHIEVCRGTIHGLIGENGSGKSTFSSIVAGIQQRDSGRLLLRGEDYAPTSSVDAAKQGVSLIVQEIGTIGSIPVSANIFLNEERRFVKHGCIDYNTMNAEAKKILSQIGGEHIDPQAITGTLNLEDRKLVEIARGMYSEPELLIIDETSNALAKHGRDILYQNMRAVRDRGGAVIFITHDLAELIDICDCVTVMRDGHYIETLFKEQMEESRLKSLMVGREVADNLYRADDAPDYQPEVVLRAEGLNAIHVYSVTIELHKGEILGIGGLAECGMHELGKVLFGIEKPDSGTVTVGGKAITSPREAIRLGVGYLSKNRDTEAIILNASIQDNICLPSLPKLTKHGFINPKREKALAAKWTDALAIKMRSSDQHCRELSGGNKQKVVLAKWMGNDSQILIMDCPTRGIDIGVKEAIYKLMQQFKKEGRSMIMISEELPELIGMSDRILIMKNHEIVQEIPRSAQIDENQLVSSMI